jgi:hypothetical protein
VEALFIIPGAMATKRNKVKHGGQIFCHESKRAALHALMHGHERGVIICQVANNKAKSFGRKVSLKHKDFPSVGCIDAGMGHSGLRGAYRRRQTMLPKSRDHQAVWCIPLAGSCDMV